MRCALFGSPLVATRSFVLVVYSLLALSLLLPRVAGRRVFIPRFEFAAALRSRASSAALSFPPSHRPRLAYQIAAIVAAYVFVLLLTGLGLLLLSKLYRRRLLRLAASATRELEEAHDRLGASRKFTGDGQLNFHRASSKRSADTKSASTFRLPFSTAARHSRASSKSKSAAAVWPRPAKDCTDSWSDDVVSISVSPIDDDPIVQADRAAMNRTLEDIYAHVMAQEDAKESGVDLRTLPAALPGEPPVPSSYGSPPRATEAKALASSKSRKKPQQLQFDDSATQGTVKPASKTATFMQALKSPIKSLRTPKTGVFPHHSSTAVPHDEEPPTPRHYVAGPLLPSSTSQYAHNRMASNLSIAEALSNDSSPDVAFPPTHIGDATPRGTSQDLRGTLKERAMEINTDPTALSNNRSSESLRTRRMSPVLPPRTTMSSSPQSPTLPGAPMGPSGSAPAGHSTAGSSAAYHYLPTPTQSMHRSSPVSATNVNGVLPFRQYDTPVSPASPESFASTVYSPTKTTVLERTALLPSGPNTSLLRTPWTAGAVPYSPYMPQTPVIPVTPRLVTREDRRQMKKAMPRTPIVEMVSDDGEVWGDGY